MTVSSVGGAFGTTTATIPAHQGGDLLVAWAFRNGSTALPTVPAGWTVAQSGGASSCSAVLAWRIATGPGTTTGTFSNAARLIVEVYRGDRALSVGASSMTFGASNTISFPTVDVADAWVATFVGHRTSTSIAATASLTQRRVTGGNPIATARDTGGPVSAFPALTAAAGANSGWRAASLVILEEPDPNAPTTVTRKVATGTDDGEGGSGLTFTSAGSGLSVGGMGAGLRTFLRFTDVPVPRGATITSARLRLWRGWASSGTVTFAARTVAADNPAAPTTNAQLNALTFTAGQTDVSEPVTSGWDGSGSVLTVELSPAQIQAVVDRAGWAPGQAMIVALLNPAGIYTWVHSHEQNAGARAAELEISYGAAGEPEPPPPASPIRALGGGVLRALGGAVLRAIPAGGGGEQTVTPNRVAEATSGFELTGTSSSGSTGSIVNVSGGAYSGAQFVRCTTTAGAGIKFARGMFGSGDQWAADLDWQEGMTRWWGLAVRLPAGFYAALNPFMALARLDNFPASPAGHTGVICRGGTWRLTRDEVGGSNEEVNLLGSTTFNLAEGAWHTIQVGQTFHRTDGQAWNQLWVNGNLIGTSTLRNFYASSGTYQSIKYGMVATASATQSAELSVDVDWCFESNGRVAFPV